MNIGSVLKVESNALNKLHDIFVENNIDGNFLLITEENIYNLYGKDVKKTLKRIGKVNVRYLVDNSITYAMEVAQDLFEGDYDYVVGLGGGRVLDVCKYAAYISKRKFISLPTTLANDGIASPIAVLKTKNGKVKSFGASMAIAIVIDTTLLTKCPINLIKAGIGDTMSNYTALLDWKLAYKRGKDSFNDFAYLMSQQSITTLINTDFKTIDENFIKVLADSIVLSGMAMQIAGSSRPVSGSEHLFSHALDFYTDCNNLHGLQVALGTITMLKLLKLDYSEVLNYLKKFDVDINPKSLNISENDFILCMRNAKLMRPNRYTCLNELKPTTSRLKKIYEELVEEL